MRDGQTLVRPSFQSIYMDLAVSLANRSTCRRLHVGCVVTSPDFRRVYALGYNGNAAGLPNDCDSDEPGKCGCLHAEDNAVVNCDVPRAFPKVVFVTHSPCVACAKRLVNLGGVERVYYRTAYRVLDAVELLRRCGIAVEELPS